MRGGGGGQFRTLYFAFIIIVSSGMGSVVGGVGPYVVLCTHHSKFGNVGSGSRTLAPW